MARPDTPLRTPTSVPRRRSAPIFTPPSERRRLTMAVHFAQKLSRLPHYEAGLHEDAAREAFGAEDVVKLASNESPWGPHPAVIEAVAGAAKGLNRYPDQHSRRLRRRIAERFDTDPARVAVGNGSCEILLAAAEALCE